MKTTESDILLHEGGYDLRRNGRKLELCANGATHSIVISEWPLESQERAMEHFRALVARDAARGRDNSRWFRLFSAA